MSVAFWSFLVAVFIALVVALPLIFLLDDTAQEIGTIAARQYNLIEPVTELVNFNTVYAAAPTVDVTNGITGLTTAATKITTTGFTYTGTLDTGVSVVGTLTKPQTTKEDPMPTHSLMFVPNSQTILATVSTGDNASVSDNLPNTYISASHDRGETWGDFISVNSYDTSANITKSYTFTQDNSNGKHVAKIITLTNETVNGGSIVEATSTAATTWTTPVQIIAPADNPYSVFGHALTDEIHLIVYFSGAELRAALLTADNVLGAPLVVPIPGTGTEISNIFIRHINHVLVMYIVDGDTLDILASPFATTNSGFNWVSHPSIDLTLGSEADPQFANFTINQAGRGMLTRSATRNTYFTIAELADDGLSLYEPLTTVEGVGMPATIINGGIVSPIVVQDTSNNYIVTYTWMGSDQTGTLVPIPVLTQKSTSLVFGTDFTVVHEFPIVPAQPKPYVSYAVGSSAQVSMMANIQSGGFTSDFEQATVYRNIISTNSTVKYAVVN